TRDPEPSKLIPLFKELGFERLIKTLSSPSQAGQDPADPLPGSAGTTPVFSLQESDIITIRDEAGMNGLVQRLKSLPGFAIVPHLIADQTGTSTGQSLTGLALAVSEEKSFSLSFDRHQSSLTEEKALAVLKPVLEDPAVKKYGHDLKNV